MEMRKFKVGDRVKVRLDSSSPYRGRTGIIEQHLPEDTRGFWYMVRFESAGLRATSRFPERELEVVTGWRPTNG
jgi:hypothetical protein